MTPEGGLAHNWTMHGWKRNLTRTSSKLHFTQRSKISGQKGRGLGHVTDFSITSPPLYLCDGWSYKLQYGVQLQTDYNE